MHDLINIDKMRLRGSVVLNFIYEMRKKFDADSKRNIVKYHLQQKQPY